MYLMFFFWYAPLLFLMAFICISPALFVPLPSIYKTENLRMRKLIYLLLLPLAVAVTACGVKRDLRDNQSLLARIDSIDAHGLQRMQTSKERN